MKNEQNTGTDTHLGSLLSGSYSLQCFFPSAGVKGFRTGISSIENDKAIGDGEI
jgi:hypothetical protein